MVSAQGPAGLPGRVEPFCTPGLWPTIQEALTASNYFVLVASPESSQSHWVDKEVRLLASSRASRSAPARAQRRTIGVGTPGFRLDAHQRLAAGPEGRLRPGAAPRRSSLGASQNAVSRRDARLTEPLASLAAPMHGRPRDASSATISGSTGAPCESLVRPSPPWSYCCWLRLRRAWSRRSARPGRAAGSDRDGAPARERVDIGRTRTVSTWGSCWPPRPMRPSPTHPAHGARSLEPSPARHARRVPSRLRRRHHRASRPER